MDITYNANVIVETEDEIAALKTANYIILEIVNAMDTIGNNSVLAGYSRQEVMQVSHILTMLAGSLDEGGILID